jgi:hypothetical protein
MTKQTLLEITQTILSDMDGDEVNSIVDTEEASQVARIVKNNYLAMMSNTIWPHTRRALTLEPRSSSLFPTYMTVKDSLKELVSVYYNTRKLESLRDSYVLMTYLEPDQFLYKTNLRDNSKDNVVTTIDDSGIKIFVLDNKAPEYYTSFNDIDIVFDSFDKQVDTTIQVSKVQAVGYIIPPFELSDNFIPDLPVDSFSLLIERSTAAAQFKLRQFQDLTAAQESIKQSRWMSRKSWTVNGGIKYPNYGKRPASGRDYTEKKWPRE